MEVANLGIKQVSASEAIKPALNYPRNEELVIQSVINSEAEGMALLRALQILVNSFGAATITQLVTKLETNPNLAAQAVKYIPTILNM